MFDDMLSAMYKGIAEASGTMPVVFKGMERHFEKGWSNIGTSRHQFHELIHLREGRVGLVIEGRTVRVDRGGTLIIRPGMAHHIQVESSQADMLVLYFGFMSAEEALGALAGDDESSTVEPSSLERFLDFASGQAAATDDRTVEPFISLRGRSRSDISGIVDRIVREDAANEYAKDLMMQFMTMELLVVLSRALRYEWEESLRVRSGRAGELIRIARDYIIENHDRDITLGDVAGYVFLSQGYFTRAFREETGMSPIAFMIQVRVDHACRLLALEDIKVSGIARTVGFASPQRFNAAFRKQMGMPPLEYRKRMLALRKKGRERP